MCKLWFEEKFTNWVPKKCYHVALFAYSVVVGVILELMPWALEHDYITF